MQDPGGTAQALLLTGYYPVLPWTAYLLVGMALGRTDLARRSLQLALLAGGSVVAVAAVALSRPATSRSDVADALLASPGVAETRVEDLLLRVGTGMFGNVPDDAGRAWLWVVAPHSSTPFDLVTTLGSALAVVGGCLLLVGGLGEGARRLAAVVFGAGTATLSLYTLHVVMRTPSVWPEEEPGSLGLSSWCWSPSGPCWRSCGGADPSSSSSRGRRAPLDARSPGRGTGGRAGGLSGDRAEATVRSDGWMRLHLGVMSGGLCARPCGSGALRPPSCPGQAPSGRERPT